MDIVYDSLFIASLVLLPVIVGLIILAAWKLSENNQRRTQGVSQRFLQQPHPAVILSEPRRKRGPSAKRKRKAKLRPVGPIQCPNCLQVTIGGNFCDQCGKELVSNTMQVQSEHVQHTPGPAVYNPQNVKSRIPSRGLSKYPAYRVIRDFCDERNLTMPNVVFANPELIPMGIYGTDRVPQGTRGLYDPATQTIYLQDPNDEGIGLHELLHYWGHVKTGNPGHYVYP